MSERKLHNKDELILELLRENPKGMFGLELVRASNGRLSRGTVYVRLGRLEEDGLVKSERVADPESKIERPRYTLTRNGQRIRIGEASGDWSPVGA